MFYTFGVRSEQLLLGRCVTSTPSNKFSSAEASCLTASFFLLFAVCVTELDFQNCVDRWAIHYNHFFKLTFSLGKVHGYQHVSHQVPFREAEITLKARERSVQLPQSITPYNTRIIYREQIASMRTQQLPEGRSKMRRELPVFSVVEGVSPPVRL